LHCPQFGWVLASIFSAKIIYQLDFHPKAKKCTWQQAAHSFSMGPTNAKRVLVTGNFSVECRDDICTLILMMDPEAHVSQARPCKIVRV